jgi:hypothetical protein
MLADYEREGEPQLESTRDLGCQSVGRVMNGEENLQLKSR